MMKFKALLLAAAVAAPATLVATQAQAQTVAVANLDGAIANSKAFQAATAQIKTTYKTQIDQAEARRTAIQAELRPLVDAYQKAAAAGGTEASLRPQATALQQKEQAAQQELGRITLPAQRAQAYAIEQIQAKLDVAVQQAVQKRGVTVLLRPEATMFAQPAADLTPAITAELDTLVPSVSTSVPANWQPGQAGGSAAAGGAAPRPAAPAAPTGKRPTGR